MKIFPIRQFGSPILRQRAKNVPLEFLKTTPFKQLVQRMIYTMRKTNAVGIAAPQIGKAFNLAVMETRPTPTRPSLKRKGPIVIVNPKVLMFSKTKKIGWEGCLSLENVRGNVPRSREIIVRYFNEKGERAVKKVTGLWARIFQHEIDHLGGITYTDRIKNMKTLVAFSEFKKRVLKKKNRPLK
ncbi:MAG: peptide deformylase [Patescibacteria group bacterium]